MTYFNNRYLLYIQLIMYFIFILISKKFLKDCQKNLMDYHKFL